MKLRVLKVETKCLFFLFFDTLQVVDRDPVHCLVIVSSLVLRRFEPMKTKKMKLLLRRTFNWVRNFSFRGIISGTQETFSF